MIYLKYFESKNSIWLAITSDYEDDEYIYFDAWETNNEDEDGEVIAKIDINKEKIIYIDDRAKIDNYAQEEIRNVINTYFTPEKRLEISIRKYNL